MAKKRKATGRNGASEKQNGFETKEGKMSAYTTYEDLADSEDEFHINRDKVMLDDGPDAKRRKRWQKEGN
jgi:U3 small nucleolar RNA-associated protein 3